MNVISFEEQIDFNRRAYESLRDQIRRDYAGRYVALSDGKVVASAATYDDVLASVRRLVPNPECYFIFHADDEPNFEIVTDYEAEY